MQYKPGHYYHVYNKAVGGQLLFREHNDYQFFISRIEKRIMDSGIRMIACCLMPNHYHLLLGQQGTFTIGQFLRSVVQSYSQYYNKRYSKRGRVFESLPAPKEVDNHEYLITLCTYIHLNPVRAGLVSEVENWPYSNYHEFVGRRNSELIERTIVSEWFNSPEEYEQYIADLSEENKKKIKKYLF